MLYVTLRPIKRNLRGLHKIFQVRCVYQENKGSTTECFPAELSGDVTKV